MDFFHHLKIMRYYIPFSICDFWSNGNLWSLSCTIYCVSWGHVRTSTGTQNFKIS